MSAPRELREHALDRTARRELHDHEGDEQDSEQRRNHQENAAGDIGAHGLLRLLELARPWRRRTTRFPARRCPARISAALADARTDPNRRSGGWCDTIAAPNSGRRETRGRARGRRWSDRRAFRRRSPCRPARRSRDWRRPPDCTSLWWRPPATKNTAAGCRPASRDMLKRSIVMSKSKASTRARYCTASISRMPASIPSWPRFLMKVA